MSGITVPTDAGELQTMLADSKKMKALFEEPDKFQEFMKNYVNVSLKRDKSIMDQVKEHTEAALTDWLREHGSNEDARKLNMDLSPNSTAAPRQTKLYNKKAIGAGEYEKYFENSADYFFSISDKAIKTPELMSKLENLRNQTSSLKPSDGGFLIPENMRAELLRVALETAIVRPRARVIPMDSLRVPFPTIDSTSNVSSVHGGIVGFWTEEGATLTESQPKFGRIVLDAKKLTLYTEAPNELMQDSLISLTTLIDELFPEALAWFEDVSFFLGHGVGEPLGFLNAPARINITRDTSNRVMWDDVITMFSRMLPQGINRAVWIVSPEVFPQLAKMVVVHETGSGDEVAGPAWIGSGQGAGVPPMSLLGRPLIISEKARSLGTPGDVNFVDFGFYLLGDRQAMTARQSEDFRFKNDVTAFRVISRVDGKPWLQSAITPQNDGATLSPFVSLGAA